MFDNEVDSNNLNKHGTSRSTRCRDVTYLICTCFQGLGKKNFTKKQEQLFAEVWFIFDKNKDGQVKILK